MSEFEFMRDLPIGQFIPGDSPLHRLDPRARILAATVFLLALTFVPSTLGLGVGLVFAIIGWRMARLSPAPALRGWRTALPFLIILALIQVFLRVGPEGDELFRVGSIVVSAADLLAGVNLILRFSAYIAVLGLATSTLSSSDITRGLESLLSPLAKVRFPVHDFVMVVQVTLRFFPLLAQTAERIAKAQASRGADWDNKGGLIKRVRQAVPLIVPLFVTSLRRAEHLALAMDARAYGIGIKRTSMVTLRWSRMDAVAISIVLIVIILMFSVSWFSV